MLRTNIVIDDLLERLAEEKIDASCKKVCQCSQARSCIHPPCNLDISSPRQHTHVKIRKLDFQSPLSIKLVSERICVSTKCLRSISSAKISNDSEFFPISCRMCDPTVAELTMQFLELIITRWRIHRPKSHEPLGVVLHSWE